MGEKKLFGRFYPKDKDYYPTQGLWLSKLCICFIHACVHTNGVIGLLFKKVCLVGWIFTDLKSRVFVHQRLNCLLLWFMFLFVFSLLNILFTHCCLNSPAPQSCFWCCPAPIFHHPLFVTNDVIIVTHLLFSFHDNIRILLSQQRETDSSQSFLLGFSFFLHTFLNIWH